MIAATAALAVLVGAGGWVLLAAKAGCGERRVFVDLAATPDAAPALSKIAARFNASKPKISGLCAEVRVSPQASAEVARALTGSGTGPLPNVWVPDSSIWVDQVRADAPNTVQAGNPSIASSPTVIALPKPVAAQLAASGRGSRSVGWGSMLQAISSAAPMQIGFPDPANNTTGLAALLTVGQLIGDRTPQARAKQVAVIRAITSGGGAGRTVRDVFAKLPRSADPATIASSVSALPATEQSVWKYNASGPAVPLVALYPAEGSLVLDYPYVRALASTDQRQAQAADRFLSVLQKAPARQDLQADGFRAADGTPGSVLTEAAGVNPQPPRVAPAPPAPAVTRALEAWHALNLPARMHVLIDTSGSMGTIVPGVGKSRIEVTVLAAQQGLGLVSDSTEMGLWEFAARLVGKRDYRQLIPMGPMSAPVGTVTRRDALAKVNTRLRATNNDTGLYDSIRAIYRIARAGYKRDRVNSVLVFTDGRNHDPAGSITLAQLLAELKRLSDPDRPIPVYMLLFGQDADLASARLIARTTSGGAFLVRTPGEINRVFLEAVGQRTCRPNC